jgi:hypothetical protein
MIQARPVSGNFDVVFLGTDSVYRSVPILQRKRSYRRFRRAYGWLGWADSRHVSSSIPSRFAQPYRAVRVGHPLDICGLGWMAEMMFPPYSTVSCVPYSASLPRIRVVTPGIVFPKFQMRAPVGKRPCPTPWPVLSVIDQNG